MASHGIPRAAGRGDRSEEAKQREAREIQSYQQLVEEVNKEVAAKEFTPELLQKTAELLKRNPEYYTVWNHRRRIFAFEFDNLSQSTTSGQLQEEDRITQTLQLIQLDLRFLVPLLLKFPKCYWIWNHRIWLLDQSSVLLPPDRSLALWTEELGLVGKMLHRDSRNFHGWDYRRTVVANVERINASGMAKQEFDYTTMMISSNLSNFSAWHNRSKLIFRILEEQQASDDERKQMLDDEIDFIHRALIDPYDQSLWFYHQNLMCTFDPELAPKAMAPNLGADQRRGYIAAEREFVEELLEDTTDCKWVYQALTELALLEAKLDGSMSHESEANILGWLARLKALDPLRKGRWMDLEKSVSSSQEP